MVTRSKFREVVNRQPRMVTRPPVPVVVTR